MKKELEYYLSPCKNNIHRYNYIENNECLIFNITNKTFFKNNNWEENILNIDTETDIIVSHYLNSTKKRRENRQSRQNRLLDTSNIYAETFHEEERCNPINQVDDTTFLIIICIPIIYFLTILILGCICCKYRKVKSNYEKLSNKENQTGAELDSKKIEL